MITFIFYLAWNRWQMLGQPNSSCWL